MAKRSAAMLSRGESPGACADMPAPSAWACHPQPWATQQLMIDDGVDC